MHDKTTTLGVKNFKNQCARKNLGTLGNFLKGKGIAKFDLSDGGITCLKHAEIYTSHGSVAETLKSHVSQQASKDAFPLECGEFVFATLRETADEDERRYSKVVKMDEIRENGYNLNIRRYADTSPPPEQFDVGTILNGGVSVPEIEDDYIQETQDGMDVLSVFVRWDGEYCDFKSEIETKEQIGDHLNCADQGVINQFERWWDKYRVSLHEIDVQVKQSEGVMWGYLKELGYE